jgi:hypothetical protein
MGTNSRSRVFDKDNNQLINMYRQMDGSPFVHGHKLFKFLEGIVIVNGLGFAGSKHVANGAGCLAAQMVAHFKTGAGDIYLEKISAIYGGPGYEYHIHVSALEQAYSPMHEANDQSHLWQDNIDKAHPQNSVITVQVLGSNASVLFNGSVSEFGVFCLKSKII